MMKKTMQSLWLLLLLAVGLTVWTACSSSDDTTTEQKGGDDQSDKGLSDTPVMKAASNLNDQMAGLNFQELDLLAERVPVMTRSDALDMVAEFETKLSALLKILQGEPSAAQRAQGRRFTFQAFNDALQLAWDLSVMLGDDGESSSSWLGLVKGTIEKEVTVQFRGFKTTFVVKKASEFYIYKNGEQVLKILSGSENNRPVWLPILIRDNFYIGQLYYRDYEINLTYDKDSTHSRSVMLTYSKADATTPMLTMSARLEDDADVLKLLTHDVQVHGEFTVSAMDNMLSFVGETNNVNYLVVDGVRIARYMEQGASKEDCERVVASLNENLTLRLMLGNAQVGSLYVATVYNAATGLYHPTIMLSTTVMGDKDYSIAAILDMLGVELPGILRTVAQIGEQQ